jgi:hypothetical protein
MCIPLGASSGAPGQRRHLIQLPFEHISISLWKTLQLARTTPTHPAGHASPSGGGALPRSGIAGRACSCASIPVLS